ncbi:helix-turn-helix domain-containing protein [Streptomyces platensis]|uniref:helix-turn-helix domain-containing protein n=1 Tax=Streptomyces platensis TaxID=58346 RepID=UPI0037970589
MGRPENPIDPQAGPVQHFAFGLRKLREEAGAPGYRAMARRAGYSAATLSQAAAGERLPTLPVLLAFVEVCRGDAAYWQSLWEQVNDELAQQPRAADDADPPYQGLARFEPGMRSCSSAVTSSLTISCS